jgi:hypothetical protein
VRPTVAPKVVVMHVVRRDLPIYSEWLGTTEGFVNTRIHPKISGCLLTQNYKDGDHVKAGQLLFASMIINTRQHSIWHSGTSVRNRRGLNKMNKTLLARRLCLPPR